MFALPEFSVVSQRLPGRAVRPVRVVLNVAVDPLLWAQGYGPVTVSVEDDVRRYVAGLVAASEATRRGGIVATDFNDGLAAATEG